MVSKYGVRAVALAIGIAAISVASAHASVVNFAFVPNSTLTLYSNINNAKFVETLTGTFSYDATTGSLTNVDIIASGGVNVTFPYSFSLFGNDAGDFGVSAAGVNDSNGVLAALQFTRALDGSSSLAPLVGSAFYNTTDGNLFGHAATGGVSVATVPEPAAWVLMLVGVGALGGALRSRRRAATVPA